MEKEGDALEAHLGIEGERVEVTPAEQDGAATVEAPSRIEGERW